MNCLQFCAEFEVPSVNKASRFLDRHQNLHRPVDLAAYLRTLLGNREDIWRISSIFALKKIGLGNRFNHCVDINSATSRVELDVNFVLRFLDPGLQLSLG